MSSSKTPLLDSLDEPENIDKLRGAVREMVKNSTLNATYKDFLEIMKEITKYQLVTDVLKNYKKAPKTEDGKYDIGMKSGYIRDYTRENPEEARARKNAASDLDFDGKKLSELGELLREKITRKNASPTTTAPTTLQHDKTINPLSH